MQRAERIGHRREQETALFRRFGVIAVKQFTQKCAAARLAEYHDRRRKAYPSPHVTLLAPDEARVSARSIRTSAPLPIQV